MDRSITWLALASGAALLLLAPLERQHAKGGELALELVRMGPEGQLRTPDSFLEEDRFKVLLTCPPGSSGYADVLVFQAGRASVPLEVQRIDSCGNRRTLQGAFRLTGSAPSEICVFLSSTPLDRSQLPNTSSALNARGVCQMLSPKAF